MLLLIKKCPELPVLHVPAEFTDGCCDTQLCD